LYDRTFFFKITALKDKLTLSIENPNHNGIDTAELLEDGIRQILDRNTFFGFPLRKSLTEEQITSLENQIKNINQDNASQVQDALDQALESEGIAIGDVLWRMTAQIIASSAAENDRCRKLMMSIEQFAALFEAFRHSGVPMDDFTTTLRDDFIPPRIDLCFDGSLAINAGLKALVDTGLISKKEQAAYLKSTGTTEPDGHSY
jgi:hypothetical protein